MEIVNATQIITILKNEFLINELLDTLVVEEERGWDNMLSEEMDALLLLNRYSIFLCKGFFNVVFLLLEHKNF